MFRFCCIITFIISIFLLLSQLMKIHSNDSYIYLYEAFSIYENEKSLNNKNHQILSICIGLYIWKLFKLKKSLNKRVWSCNRYKNTRMLINVLIIQYRHSRLLYIYIYIILLLPKLLQGYTFTIIVILAQNECARKDGKNYVTQFFYKM